MDKMVRERVMRGTTLMREPAVQFAVLGLVIWLVSAGLHAPETQYRIEINAQQVKEIREGYARQFGSAPTQAQLGSLLNRHIDDEISYREGKAMGLDADDEIIRRRIVQKFEFLFSDQVVPSAPSEEALERWYKAHEARYRDPGRTSFEHMYFSADDGGAAAAENRARVLLSKIAQIARPADYGDVFPGPAEENNLSPSEITRIFGNSPLSAILPKLPVGSWTGPYRSGYGWHLVRVTDHTPSVIPPFAEIREQVLADFQNAERVRINRTRQAELRRRYSVRYLGQAL